MPDNPDNPDDPNYLPWILLVVGLVLLNAFFVAAEYAIVKVRGTRLKELKEGNNSAAKYAYRAQKRLDAYLSATQFGITLSSLVMGWVCGAVIAARFLIPIFTDAVLLPETTAVVLAYALAFGAVAFLHVVLGELVPKALAIQRAEGTALWTAWPMWVLHWLFRPMTVVFNVATAGVLKLFGVKPAGMAELVPSEEELRMLIAANDGENTNGIEPAQAELLDKVFDFSKRLARQVMQHRTEILALDIEDSLEENVARAREGGHSRYPVIQGEIDTVVGFVHTKDLFALYQQQPHGNVGAVLREILIAPETARADLLLRMMQRKRQHMALLVDEYGGTSGLVTIADLLEELVGDLPDEFEPIEEEWFVQVGDDTWSVDGRVPFEEFEEVTGRELPCTETCDTIGGYAFWAFGRIPDVNDQTETDDVAIRVLAMDGRRISRMEVALKPERGDHEEEEVVEGNLLLNGGR